MKLTFLGAAHEVTGSCYLLEACGKTILIDCGMEQGPDEYENQEIPVSPSSIDWVLLTHAHIDHSGRLPLLYAHGFRGKIFATGATCDLCDIMLRDSAHIQMFEAEWRNRKAKRAGGEPYIPLYNMEDAAGAISCFVSCRYGEAFSPSDGIQVRFADAGHLLGSASIELQLTERNVTKTLVFSGDIGNKNQPLLRDPQYFRSADYVVMESTYGDRSHGERPDYVKELSEIIQTTFDRGGNVVIPSFAVGRTQELLYFLRQIKADGLISGHDGFEVYVDSPLAVESTEIFQDNRRDYFDQEALELLNRGINPIQFPGLRVSLTSEESKAINEDQRCKVILSASGMCEAGRIRHHLKHNLWRANSAVVFVGFQSPGTLGRRLLDGVEKVKLFGEEIAVKAKIVNFQGLSSHADHDHLVEWIKAFDPKPAHVFVVHGDEDVAPVFAEELCSLGFKAHAAKFTECYDLAANEMVSDGYISERKRTAQKSRADNLYAKLVAAAESLLEFAKRCKGRPNKDISALTGQIISLIERFRE